ncbi:hypothetical protein [Streptomyces sp. NPDC057854]|uniref:phage tail assembly protein T n=1 Tax=unclassified Streptomyces TaxID=2593676 RepID=UPI0036A02F96
MTVGELLARISSAELTEWMAYEQVAGILGPERLDLLHSITTATVANTARTRGRAARPADFMPKWDQGAAREQPWEQMLATVTAMNAHLRGADLRKEKP